MTRRLLVGVHDQEPRLYSRIKADIESQLRKLASVDIAEIPTLSGLRSDLDLLIVISPPVHETAFEQWLKGMEGRLSNSQGIWIPCLMIAGVDFQDLNPILSHVSSSNWYFDVVNPSHLSSLPIRVANLTRINAHIKELRNYDRQVKELSARVEELEDQIKLLGNRND